MHQSRYELFSQKATRVTFGVLILLMRCKPQLDSQSWYVLPASERMIGTENCNEEEKARLVLGGNVREQNQGNKKNKAL